MTPPASAWTAQPRVWRVRLTAAPQAVGTARQRVRKAIASGGVPVDADAACLIASELVTNAVRAEPGSCITLCIIIRATGLRIEVCDTSPDPPAATAPDPSALAGDGRGLVLVAALAGRWDWRRLPGGGKAVGATLKTGETRP